MKKQKVLELAKAAVGGHISLLIQGIEQRKKVEGEIAMCEDMISGKLVRFFGSHADYEPFKNLLSLQVHIELAGHGKLSTKTLLEQLSLQIAGSINKFYDVAENHPVGYINWGFESYFISHEEWSTHFESLKIDFIKEKFEQLSNVFWEKFGVRFQVIQCNCNVNEVGYIKIFVKIFL